jgi:hypothetical protein
MNGLDHHQNLSRWKQFFLVDWLLRNKPVLFFGKIVAVYMTEKLIFDDEFQYPQTVPKNLFFRAYKLQSFVGEKDQLVAQEPIYQEKFFPAQEIGIMIQSIHFSGYFSEKV